MAKTGLSRPYVAKYNYDPETEAISYSDGMRVAKAINADFTPAGGNDNILYGDNGPAESDNSFTGGSLDLGVTELPFEAAALMLGMTVEDVTLGGGSTATGKRLKFNGHQQSPYLGYGTIVDGVEDGTPFYMAFILHKIQFAKPASSFTTREESITWQTPSLSATVMLNDAIEQEWSEWVRFPSYADADAYVRQFLNISDTPEG